MNTLPAQHTSFAFHHHMFSQIYFIIWRVSDLTIYLHVDGCLVDQEQNEANFRHCGIDLKNWHHFVCFVIIAISLSTNKASQVAVLNEDT